MFKIEIYKTGSSELISILQVGNKLSFCKRTAVKHAREYELCNSSIYCVVKEYGF